ncbi:MAG: NIPSNAP family protein [Rubripirellula sp.]
MKPIFTLCLLSCSLLPATVAIAEQSHQYYEIRSYVLGEDGDHAAINGYLSQALLPALQRQNVGPVGVFTNAESDKSDSKRIIAVIPYDSADAMVEIKSKLDADPQYREAAKTYLDRGPKNAPYGRIESELLVAMDCMPALKVPEGAVENDDRVFELRVYESGNERLGNLKVDMFNNGEVPIFLDCGIQPIFIGQALIGPVTPNLSYLTVYPSESARNDAWVAFRSHPDWLVLKEVAKYQGTVSKIHKYVLVPTDYSQI